MSGRELLGLLLGFVRGERLRWGRPLLGVPTILALAVGLASPSAASASETVIGFDGAAHGEPAIAAGEEVADQYEAEGLRLGKASAFGRTSPGECDWGSPTVEENSGFAFSSPSVARLTQCSSGNSSGAYGALLDHPDGPVSVQIRSLPGAGSAEVEAALIIYDSEGNEIEHMDGKAKKAPEPWTELRVVNRAK
jgi:hypothetical protein